MEFDQNFKCITCIKRYSLNNYTCKLVQNYDEKCLKYVDDVCRLCMPPNYIIGGTCNNAFCLNSNGI